MNYIFNKSTYILTVTTILILILSTPLYSQEEYNAEEAKFIGILQEASRAWRDAPNDIQREKIPTNRTKHYAA